MVASCPYPGCGAPMLSEASGCPSCHQIVAWCQCGTANRLLARYCRRCRMRLHAPAEWRLPKGSAQGSAFAPLTLPAEPSLSLVDRIHLGGRLRAQFVYGHGHLFFPISEQGVLVYREWDRRMVAHIPGRSKLLHSLAVTDESLLIAGDGGLEAVALRPLFTRGEAAAQVLLSQPVAAGRGQSLLVLDEPNLVCVASQHAVHAIGQGERQGWSLQRSGIGGVMLVQTAQRLLVVVEESGTVSCVDPATGARHWEQRLSEPLQLRAGCAASDNKVYMVGRSGTLIALMVTPARGVALQTGHQLGDVTGLASDGLYLYVTGLSGLQRCVPSDPYATSLAPLVSYAPPVVTRNLLFAGTDRGTLLFMDAAAEGQRYQVSGAVASLPDTSPVLTGQRIWLGSGDGEVAVFSIDPGEGAA